MQGICSACSFAKSKILEWGKSIQETRVENTLEKINSGDLGIKSYTVVEGERLWDIAENLQEKANINVDIRDVVSIIKDINNAKEINVDVLYEGQTIYIPTDLKEVM